MAADMPIYKRKEEDEMDKLIFFDVVAKFFRYYFTHAEWTEVVFIMPMFILGMGALIYFLVIEPKKKELQTWKSIAVRKDRELQALKREFGIDDED